MALVLRAQELGINHFDTGPSYGAGEAERRLGLALRAMDRRGLVISTKVGTFVDAGGNQFKSFDPARIRDSVQESLARMGLAKIDILYLHGPGLADLSTPVVDCLSDLKSRGIIRYSGVNTFNREVLKRLVDTSIDVVMPQYNIFDIKALPQIEALKSAGKTIISATALGQGIFDFRALFPTNKKSLWYFLRALKNDPLFPLTRMQAARRISALGHPTLEAALLFLVNTKAITSSVFGTASIAHLEQNAEAASRIAQYADK